MSLLNFYLLALPYAAGVTVFADVKKFLPRYDKPAARATAPMLCQLKDKEPACTLVSIVATTAPPTATSKPLPRSARSRENSGEVFI